MFKSSKLYSQDTFDRQFLRDLKHTRSSVIIESPFIRLNRVNALLSTIATLRRRGVVVIINTRNPDEHDDSFGAQAATAIDKLQNLGVSVLFTVKHHRKIAIIDKRVFYEGSLNILSYYDSCEIMRRTASSIDAEILINFIGLNDHLTKAR